MRSLSHRIIVPVLLATLCTAGFLGFFGWKLLQTRSILAGQLLQQAGIHTDTSTDIPTVIEQPHSNDEALFHLRKGDILALQGEWSEAAEAYQEAVDADGGLTALRKLVQAQLQIRDMRAARSTLAQLKRAGARAEDIVLLESLIHIRGNELPEATTLLTSSPDSPQKHYGLALLAIVQGQHDIARSELQLVIAGWEPVLRTYARSLAGAYEEFSLFPESSQIHLNALLARALASVQECELALPLLTRITTEQDDYRDAWILQGVCQLQTNRSHDSLLSLERAYALDPEKPETQYLLGRAYVSEGDNQNAITFFQYALRNGFQPETEVRQRLAHAAVAVEDGALALQQLDALSRLPEASFETTAEFISIALELGQKEEAFIRAGEAANKWPDDAHAHELLGIAARETGRLDDARAAFLKALEINPHLGSARQALEELQM